MIFITGATGLVGSHVLLELLVRCKEVRAMYRKKERQENVLRVFRHYLGDKGEAEFAKIHWVKGDILDIDSLRDGISGCDIVYHCAAMVTFTQGQFRQLIKSNKEGTANVVNICLASGINHICYISSTAAIGKTTGKEILDESDQWNRSAENSNYSVSKHLAEMEVWRGMNEGLNAVVVNPGVVLGPGNWDESSLTIFKIGKKGMRLYASGGNGFVDARDVARITAELSERNIFNERFLMVSENVPFREIMIEISTKFGTKPPSKPARRFLVGLAWRGEAVLKFLFGKPPRLTRETARAAMRMTCYSSEKLRSRIGYEFIPVKKSIEDAVAYFKKSH